MEEITLDILTQAAQGDLKAFETVYRASSRFVYNVAFRVVGTKEDAEEVVQDVFLTVHQKLKDFRFESSFKTWVYRITVNSSINLARKSSKTKDHTVELDETINMPTASSETEIRIDQEHHDKVVEDILSVLNPDQRACMVLRNVEGLSYEEIAKSLQININTVRTRLKRAREKILASKKQVNYAQL